MEGESGPWRQWRRVSRSNRQLPCHGDLGRLEADALPQPVTPGFELAPLRRYRYKLSGWRKGVRWHKTQRGVSWLNGDGKRVLKRLSRLHDALVGEVDPWLVPKPMTYIASLNLGIVEAAEGRIKIRGELSLAIDRLQQQVLETKTDPEDILEAMIPATRAIAELHHQDLLEARLILVQRQTEALELIANRRLAPLAGIEAALQEIVNTWSPK